MDVPAHWRDLPVGEYAFPGPLRDRLVAAIADGSKTSTSHLLLEDELDGTAPPAVGDREVVVDSAGTAVLVTEVVSVEVVPLADVTLAHAVAEGEGFATVAQWRAGHEGFWHSADYRQAVRDPLLLVDDDTRVVCVGMQVVVRA